jgi:DNA-binding phage protein
MSRKLTDFDMSALLDNDEAISEYLYQVLADGDAAEIGRAIDYVIEVYRRWRAGP